MVKRYIAEDDSPQVRRWLDQGLPAAARLSEVELALAIELRRRLAYPLAFGAFDRRVLDAAHVEGLDLLKSRA